MRAAKANGWLNEVEVYGARRSVQMSTTIEVLVTETRHPVYLALASHDEVFWVIRKAPNVTVDGVMMIGFKPPALVGGPGADRTGFLLSGHNFKKRDTSGEMQFVSAADVHKARRENAANRKCFLSPEEYFSAAEQAEIQPANYVRTKEDFARYKVKEKNTRRGALGSERNSAELMRTLAIMASGLP